MKPSRLGSNEKQSLWSRIKQVALTDVGALMRGLNADDLENMERVLIEADFGVPATVELTGALEDEVRRGKLKTEADLKRALRERLSAMLAGPENPGAIARAESGPTIILLVGVNGTGKTTTAAKLAARLQQEGRTVLNFRSGPTVWICPVSRGHREVILHRWPSTRSTQPSPGASIPSSSTRPGDSTPRKD
jgi:signal recognition particle GTPase